MLFTKLEVRADRICLVNNIFIFPFVCQYFHVLKVLAFFWGAFNPGGPYQNASYFQTSMYCSVYYIKNSPIAPQK